ncbi:hypothetical protein KBTX_02867 [wastewater metagenome]|uniref:Signaling protein n=2 Tax=unclassified sequences TaxID=12908 RepID=A0A5B8RID1_9ZZZZ|nr:MULTISPECIES: bifunctional diguanylate cyclase/phosphodiesterase [Arhodomonas]MCS4502875.1 bifunctional diguanylate cyclase/phosphodiesterase [Arhodomonas aquaeolei]QEA06527.1 hypothetical protein KBTEX_02867 [uncultured organism]
MPNYQSSLAAVQAPPAAPVYRLMLDGEGRVTSVATALPEALAGLARGDSVDGWLTDAVYPARSLSLCLAALRAGCAGIYLSLRGVCDPGARFAGRLVPYPTGAVALELEAEAEADSARSSKPSPLLGRAEFLSVLETAAGNGAPVAVGCIDIDRLRQINLGYGHACGDTVLAEVGRRLQRLAGTGARVANLGGDEFGVVMTGPGAPARAREMAEALDQSMRRPIFCHGRELLVTVSAGFAASKAATGQAEGPLVAAEAALQRARRLGRCWVLFDDEPPQAPDHHSARAVALEVALHRALEEDEFSLAYQPIVSLGSGEVCGVETLLRWHWEDGQPVPPDQFVPVLEDTGLIRPVGAWVLRRACEELVATTTPGGRVPEVAVNVSVEQLHESGFVDEVAAVLRDTGLDPRRLTLEITEHRLIGDNSTIIDTLRELRALGVRLAVDDFGTGYSSLAYLLELPVQVLKVDRSFVQGLWKSPAGQVIMQAIVSMATDLGLQVVVEGVEREEEARFLARWPELLAQGYLYGAPMPLARLLAGDGGALRTAGAQ